MNLRILKKLSKKAAPLLAHFDHRQDTFLAERGANYHGLPIETHPKDRWRNADHPLKGTPMVGAMRGYKVQEWEERTALEELMHCILYHDKPASMSDADYLLAQKITGCTPIDYDNMDDWDAADEDREAA